MPKGKKARARKSTTTRGNTREKSSREIHRRILLVGTLRLVETLRLAGILRLAGTLRLAGILRLAVILRQVHVENVVEEDNTTILRLINH